MARGGERKKRKKGRKEEETAELAKLSQEHVHDAERKKCERCIDDRSLSSSMICISLR